MWELDLSNRLAEIYGKKELPRGLAGVALVKRI